MSTELVVRRTCDSCGASSDDESQVVTLSWSWTTYSYKLELCQSCKEATEGTLSHLFEISRDSNERVVKDSKLVACDVCKKKFKPGGIGRHMAIHKKKPRKSA